MHSLKPNNVLKAVELVMMFGMPASIAGGITLGAYLAVQAGTTKEAVDNALWSVFVVGLPTAIAFEFAADFIHYINHIGQRAALQQQGTNSMEDVLSGVPTKKGLCAVVGETHLGYFGKPGRPTPLNYAQMQKV